MATFDFEITDAMVGQIVGPPDGGYLVNLTQTAPQSKYEIPSGDDGSGIWRSGYLTLKGERDHQAIFNYCPSQGGHVSRFMVANNSLAYRGGLKIQAVPRGSVWGLTLSDAPVARSPSP